MNVFSSFLNAITAPFRWLISGPARLIGLPRRLFGLSLPARVAWALGLGLAIMTLGVALYLIFGRDDLAAAETLYRPSVIATTVLVLIAAPTTAYFLLKLWIEGDVARFPDIDDAWSAGMAALEQQGIDPTQRPIFLLIGQADEASVRRTIDATGYELKVEGEPRGPAPLRWFATSDAIYVSIEGAGWLGTLDQAAMPSPLADSQPTSTPSLGATMVIGSGAAAALPPGPAAGPGPGPAAAAPVYGTLVLDGPIERAASAAPRSNTSRAFLDEDAERLRYVASRLRRLRQPFCANNGVLVMLSVRVLEDIVIAKDVPTALRADLEAIREETRLLAPVVLMVVGLEAEIGLQELVSRVGVDSAKGGRFGKRFDVWNEATDENLDALASHACGAFEDWVYQLYRDGLEDKGNTKLYSLLSRVRHRLQSRLRNVLVKGLAVEASEASETEPVLFGGCYFAATGAGPTQQAFVGRVFDRVADLANDLSWRPAAVREDAAMRLAAQGLLVVNLGLLVAAGVLVYKLLGG
ncbi:MAG: hypothetical protein AAFV43_14795 [Planctomycetota bacterium]